MPKIGLFTPYNACFQAGHDLSGEFVTMYDMPGTLPQQVFVLFQLGLAPLPDNDPRDKYYYEILVSTGMRRNAGTESKVGRHVTNKGSIQPN